MKRSALLALFAALSLLAAGCPGGGKGAAGNDGPPAADPAPKELVLGFVPSQEADKIADTAKPMADFLARELGIPVRSFISTNYVGLVEAMGSDKVDIGSLPPLAYVLANDQGAADVLLKTSRKGSHTYHAMFIARAGSGIASIEQARGKRVAWTDSASTSGYLFPAAYLKARGHDPENFFSQVTFTQAHDNSVRFVYNGDVDVAAVYDDARNRLERTLPDVKKKVVKIGQTDEIPNDTISVRPGLHPDLKQKIKAAFLKYAASPEGKKTLMEIYEIDGFAEAKNSDYDSVRQVAQTMNVGLGSVE